MKMAQQTQKGILLSSEASPFVAAELNAKSDFVVTVVNVQIQISNNTAVQANLRNYMTTGHYGQQPETAQGNGGGTNVNVRFNLCGVNNNSYHGGSMSMPKSAYIII